MDQLCNTLESVLFRGNRFVGTVASDGLTIWKLQTRRFVDLANNKLH